MSSDSYLVKDFTLAAGQEVPHEPKLMSKDEVHFLIKMMLDEIMELYATVEEPSEAKLNMIKMICSSKDIPKIHATETELIAEQADALIDCYYYSLNCAAKKGVNLSDVFKVVHDANMKKRDPESGMFIKRADGKIIKPHNWISPDIPAEIERQKKEGSWSHQRLHNYHSS